MTDTQTSAARDGRGRFQPGASGNPAGKKPGTLNHATRLKRSLEEGDFDTAARSIVVRAVKGEFVAARFLVEKLDPKPRGRPIELDMPEDASPAERFAVVTRAMCRGEITPDEALVVVRVLEAEDKRGAQAATPKPMTKDEEHAAWLAYRRECVERDAQWDAAAERVWGAAAASHLHSTSNSGPEDTAPPSSQPIPSQQAGEASEGDDTASHLHPTSISPIQTPAAQLPVDAASLLPTPRRRAVNRARTEAARRGGGSGWAG